MSEAKKAFLFVWNSKYWSFDKIEPLINEIKTTGKAEDIWGIASHKKVRIGDRIYITRVNAGVKGIIASGTVISNPEPFINYKQKEALGVRIEFDTFLNPDENQILDILYVKANTSAYQQWSPYSSGIEINPKIVDELESLWSGYLSANNLITDLDNRVNYIIEGTSYQLVQTIYERNSQARKLCLDHYGYTCVICEFNFKDKYGEIGSEFIHVHHLSQLSNTGEIKTDPIVDLRPVCPNCHAMLHRKNPPYTIDEIKARITN